MTPNKKQIAVFEDMNEKIFGLFPENMRGFLQKQRFFTSKIDEIEEFIYPFMKEDGTIDGKMLNDVVQYSASSSMFKYVTFPDADFVLSEMIDSIINIFNIVL